MATPITQYEAYLPYGELLVDEHSSSEDMPYKFNGKEMDEETGLYYYGARYMNPVSSMWYGVDPLKEKYPKVSPFIYCMNNPIIHLDIEGKFPTKSAATISRWWYNLWHKDKAGPVIENEHTANRQLRFTYCTYSGLSNEFEITLHYKFSTKFVKGMQDVGDGVALAGYATTLSVVGAEAGIPMSVAGNTISSIGGAGEMALDIANGDYGNGFKSIAFKILEKGTEKVLNKFLPGFGKKIGEEGFNIGTEILDQGRKLKQSGLERVTDKIIEKKQEENNKDKETKK